MTTKTKIRLPRPKMAERAAEQMAKHFPDYIREPRAFRANAEMPAMAEHLTNADLKELVKYLKGMKRAKICESVADCRQTIENR